MGHDAGAADADVDDRLRLADAVESARHEGVILHGVGKDHELGTAHIAALGRLLDDPAHEGHGVHVDARPRGADVDARADEVRAAQRLGQGADEAQVTLGKALLGQGREAADEVYAGLPGRPVKRVGDGAVVRRGAGGRHKRDRRDGDALIHDGDAELVFDVAAGFHEVSGAAADLVIDLAAAGVHVRVGAV